MGNPKLLKEKLYDTLVELGVGFWATRGNSFLSQRKGAIAIPPEEFIKLVCGDNGGGSPRVQVGRKTDHGDSQR